MAEREEPPEETSGGFALDFRMWKIPPEQEKNFTELPINNLKITCKEDTLFKGVVL